MKNDLKCPRCGEEVEPEAAFCGNCGQQLSAAASSPIAKAYLNGVNTTYSRAIMNPAALGAAATAAARLPGYAIAVVHPHNHLKAALSVIFGVLGIAGAFFIPILGIGFGIAGLVLASLTPRHLGHALRTIGIIASCLAIVAGLATWVYLARNDTQSTAPQASTTNGVASLSVTTPCYTIDFSDQLNVDNTSGSCAMNAYNGSTMTSSSNVYKVLVTEAQDVTAANLASIAKTAIQNDVSENLPGFTITSEQSGSFAGDPAYFVQANDTADNVAVEEAAVLHSAAQNNFYVLVHITTGASTGLSDLEQQWQWK